jgi:hypothetical protein
VLLSTTEQCPARAFSGSGDVMSVGRRDYDINARVYISGCLVGRNERKVMRWEVVNSSNKHHAVYNECGVCVCRMR